MTSQSSSAPKSTYGQDLLASVVVFLVALPLCMGISIASGMPPTAGIITGIIGGLIVGVLAGSPLQVSGPAAGLSVLVLQFVQANGVEMLGVVVLFAGLFQLAAGVLRLGQWFRAVSPAVIHGMLAGIGVLILVAQFHVMLDGKPLGTGIQNLIGMPGALLTAIEAGDHRLKAAGIGLLTIVTIAGWSFAPKSWRLMPAPLVGVVVAMLAAGLLGLSDIHYVVVPDNIWSTVVFPTPDNLMRIVEAPILIGAISIAFIASAETLLCATAVDQMHRGPRTKYDRELSAQGVGNALCGLLGVLPMTGVIVRSSANVDAGAVTRLSAIMHGVWLLLFASVLPFTLSYIPISALAAVLVYTGYKLAYPKIVPTLQKFGTSEVAIYFITVATIVATNLLAGVVVGLVLSLLKLLYAFSHLEVRKVEEPNSNRVDLHLKGAATLIRLPMLASELEGLKPNTHVHIHIDDLDYIDHACIDLLTNWDRQHKASGGSLEIEWEGLTQKYQNRSGLRARAEATGR
ncbi:MULTISPECIES: SulP family inorganic anion transporter [Hyphomicrobium]|jgi:MFS superfamily sulfate permease-like transporter|uniref:SulP family inorganic anion transporter n=1 Tax=Hyphomicrobium TaxID=81 RepID=UPI00035F301F|nr:MULTISPECIES: SulP family inorganic anion transporter [Hyphomicrobium]WBT38552.1 SulP family inorganic anion transporter [Hyphomicrobium sp. DMF-1]HML43303.1 SulP family inorganic anion transporter [Hyphomicrobium zavarzinii]